jgi:succinate dehydrogenase / fumarate reductase cytochrome b subunit
MRYVWETGAVAWLLHRITGVVVAIYIVLHILAQFGTKYDHKGLAAIGDLVTAKAVFVVILARLIYHSVNGIRELIVDFGSGALYYKKLFWTMMGIGAVIYAVTLAAL